MGTINITDRMVRQALRTARNQDRARLGFALVVERCQDGPGGEYFAIPSIGLQAVVQPLDGQGDEPYYFEDSNGVVWTARGYQPLVNLDDPEIVQFRSNR